MFPRFVAMTGDVCELQACSCKDQMLTELGQSQIKWLKSRTVLALWLVIFI